MRLPRSLAALLLLFFVQLGGLPALAQTATGPSFPALSGRVVDQANILSPEIRTQLTDKLQALQDKTTTQLVVVTLASLGGNEIADYGYQLGRAWGIGQKGSNNGAILIVAPNERKVRIEVGYGLEPTLTDAISRLIIENAILPRFRAGDFPGGIVRGTDDLIQVLSGGAEEFKQRAAEQGSSQETDQIDWVTFLVVGFILLVFLSQFFGGGGGSAASRRRGGFVPPIFFPGGGGGRSGGFGGGGGFSGGGGSFGGGGASGSW